MGSEHSSLSEEFGSEKVKRNKVNFKINGKSYNVNENEEIDPNSLLVDFIRDKAGLKGTKFMCREGGCGACVVTLKSKCPITHQNIFKAVNSCLIPTLSCDGKEFLTIESLGNRSKGYHPIQERLVKFGGSQCGFCSPGMVMSMYSLASSNKKMTCKEIEDNLDGNICRCTGYRPILEAFKSFAVNASEELKRKTAEFSPCSSSCACSKIEEGKIEEISLEDCEIGEEAEEVESLHLSILTSGEEWVKATNLGEAFKALQEFTRARLNFMIVAGNTGKGVYPLNGDCKAFLDVSSVRELTFNSIQAEGINLGSCVTLANAIQLLKKASETDGFSYALPMAKHLQRVANTPVRNMATLGGNLMIKHQHREFPSDVFTLLETIGTKIIIGYGFGQARTMGLLDFLNLDMNGKIIIGLALPCLKGNYFFRSFKIARRYQNSHAYVNAGFLFKLDPKRNFSIREKPSIVYGGVNPNFVHGAGTEVYLVGKFLGDEKCLKGALDVLDKEVNPQTLPHEGSKEFLKGLTQSLFYKFVVGVLGPKCSKRIESAGNDLEHLVTRAKQSYEIEKSDFPLYQPIAKLEGLIQASGEAEYLNDINPEIGELFGVFILSQVANADLKLIDFTNALKIPGVVACVSAKDIPGVNDYMTLAFIPSMPEELFATKKIICAGQSLGMIVAENKEIACKAAKLVRVEYENIKAPIIHLKAALLKAETEGNLQDFKMETKRSEFVGGFESTRVITGEMEMNSQYHFQMETQSALCIPTEDGYDIYSATQWIDQIQVTVANVLNIPQNSLNIKVKRIGGGYGSKITRASQVACAAAVAAFKTRKPVRVILDLETNMNLIGKRHPYLTKYEVGFDESGRITKLKSDIICDTGCHPNEPTALFAMLSTQSCYGATNWDITPTNLTTNTAPNTYCRAPGSTRGVALIETIMEHIAFELKKDPLEVRMANLIKEGDPIFAIGVNFEGPNYIPDIVKQLKNDDFDARKRFVENFNQTNRWIKRGISLVPMRYPCHYLAIGFTVFIAIYPRDGTICVTHGGIEMGQGINTKVAQTVAYKLNIPIDLIKIKPTNNLTGASNFLSGGATTSELCCYAAMKTCDILIERMSEVKSKLDHPNWLKLLEECHKEHVDLTASYMMSAKDGLVPYDVWGVNVTEVEVDILTGEYKILRSDVIEDAGKSLSPEIDIGQIEGALMMGYGNWTTEKIIHCGKTGKLLTNRTWTYKPPMGKDIPEDLRITIMKNVPNPLGVLRSKATGEPPQCLSVSVVFALKQAITSARKDSNNEEFFQLDGPVTPDEIFKLSLSSKSQYSI